jgi:hypothetical protein
VALDEAVGGRNGHVQFAADVGGLRQVVGVPDLELADLVVAQGIPDFLCCRTKILRNPL